jgi:hypothetical protein
MISGGYWVSWSARQQAVHVESVAEGQRNNLEAFAEGRATDYVPLAIFSSLTEAREFAETIKKIRDNYQGGGSRWN